MKHKIVTSIIAASLALVSASAFSAHSITNGDAETGDLTGWTPSGTEAFAGDSNYITAGLHGGIPQAGTYSFVFAGANGLDSVPIGSATSMDQDVYAWGCGVEYLEGTVTVDYQVSTVFDDTGEIGLGYRDAIGDPLTGSSQNNIASAGAFSAGAFSSQAVPTNAFWLNLSVGGRDSGSDGYVDVSFDSVSITTSGCLDNFAKISGKIMGSGGNRGQWSFEGAVGTDEDSGDAVGSIHINYKSLGETCWFTPDPSGLSFINTEDIAVVFGEVDCVDGDAVTTVDGEDFILVLDNSDDTTNNKGKDKDRGSVCLLVDADAGAYDIGAPCAGPVDLVPLKNGNVHVDDDTSDDLL